MNEIYDPRGDKLYVGESHNQWVEAIAALALLVTAIATLVDKCNDSGDERREE